MLRHILIRLFQGIISLLIVSVVIFALSRATGNPVELMVPMEATQHDRDVMAATLGLDKPLPEQYFIYVSHTIRGDLGDSIRYGKSVSSMYFHLLPNTAELALSVLLFVLLTAVPLGILSALRKDSVLDWVARVLCTIGVAMPVFWLGLILMQIFSVKLGWLPSSGIGGPRYFILPTVTLGSLFMAGIARLLRSGMVEVLDTEYVKLLKAKGLSETRVLLHVIRNAAIAPLTYLGQYTALLLGGALVVEMIFRWPGVGRFAYEAIVNRDFPVIQGVILINAAILILANLLVDILYAYVDPRIKSSV